MVDYSSVIGPTQKEAGFGWLGKHFTISAAGNGVLFFCTKNGQWQSLAGA